MDPSLGIAHKRSVPLNKPVKLTALFFHLLGFSVWFGGAVSAGTVHHAFPIMTVASGLVLIAREVYKHGFAWFITTEGVFTLPKIAILIAAQTTGSHDLFPLGVVLVLGFLGSRLPERNVLSLVQKQTGQQSLHRR